MTTITTTKTVPGRKENQNVHPPCKTFGKTNHSIEKNCYGANAAKTPPPWHRRPEGQKQVPQKNSQTDSNEIAQAAAQNLN